jgi:hypothetical protein
VILGDKIMKIIYAPNKPDFNRTTVFLAGSIEGFKSNLESLPKEESPDLTLVYYEDLGGLISPPKRN